MTNRYDEVEHRFGIRAYASPHGGFAAVVKARYSDFIVHEGASYELIVRFVADAHNMFV